MIYTEHNSNNNVLLDEPIEQIELGYYIVIILAVFVLLLGLSSINRKKKKDD